MGGGAASCEAKEVQNQIPKWGTPRARRRVWKGGKHLGGARAGRGEGVDQTCQLFKQVSSTGSSPGPGRALATRYAAEHKGGAEPGAARDNSPSALTAHCLTLTAPIKALPLPALASKKGPGPAPAAGAGRCATLSAAGVTKPCHFGPASILHLSAADTAAGGGAGSTAPKKSLIP